MGQLEEDQREDGHDNGQVGVDRHGLVCVELTFYKESHTVPFGTMPSY